MRHITTHSLIKVSQHGFLSRMSCFTNLLEFLEYVTNAVEQNKPVDVYILRFPKKKHLIRFRILGHYLKWRHMAYAAMF